MGTELIGYVLIGPKSIQDMRAEAIERVTEELAAAKDIEATLMGGKLLSVKQINFLESQGVDAEYIENIQASYTDVITEITSAEKWVDDFIDFWENTDSRDSMDRFYGDKKIVAVGESSCGDEPTGYGYTMLKTLLLLNVSDIFGIE